MPVFALLLTSLLGCTNTEPQSETTPTVPEAPNTDNTPQDYVGVFVDCASPDTSDPIVELKKKDGTTDYADFPECFDGDFTGKEFKVTFKKQMVESCLDPMCDETKKEEQWVGTATLNDGRPESYSGTLTGCEEPDFGGSLAVLKLDDGSTKYASFDKCSDKKHSGKQFRVTFKKKMVESCLDPMCDETKKEEQWVDVVKRQ